MLYISQATFWNQPSLTRSLPLTTSSIYIYIYTLFLTKNWLMQLCWATAYPPQQHLKQLLDCFISLERQKQSSSRTKQIFLLATIQVSWCGATGTYYQSLLFTCSQSWATIASITSKICITLIMALFLLRTALRENKLLNKGKATLYRWQFKNLCSYTGLPSYRQSIMTDNRNMHKSMELCSS